MNLQKMFEMQKVLDDRIIKEKGLEGQDLLPNLILALQVELAECANEWRGFKHWSNDREPRNHCKLCQLIETPHICQNPLLEEYVDCLHFILSIGNHIDYKIVSAKELQVFFCEVNLTEQFASLFEEIVYMAQATRGHSPAEQSLVRYRYESLFQIFIGLGVMLDFTTEQIEAAYMEKNAVNHQRQQEGY
ncbi:dUTP diphosphatase [Bacillus velezensis]|uniref:dUTP diphosphatase n=1 Tax=Bacillus velezensis TaxID=492670 RepID=UPI0027A18DF1|nr:dUTP diphosphatase [Bacillus velezensis]MEC2288561.1 dUTP diphosphatase [Bacillus velezensis]MEC2422455.1 dUTP diphosphatase [Bacillus velezensis]WFF76321.1 dUTP diphosphatase [Bacillus velezensis]WFF76397.1 dUTP diphosphatase [Bacillus velezensis]